MRMRMERKKVEKSKKMKKETNREVESVLRD